MKTINRDKFFILLGILGSMILFYGQTIDPPQQAYSLGSLLLFFTAIHFKLLYFIALELILTSGHAAIMLHIGPYLQIALPVLLCLQLLLYYFIIGQSKNIYLIIGIIGIALLSIGFSYESEWVFFLGGIAIASYSFYCVYKGQRVCYIWGILNAIFAITALYRILF
jgi:hypothetical protein